MDTHDDRKSAKAVNTAMVSAGLKAAEASEVEEELTDDELAKIAGGLNPQPLPPSPPHPERVT
jgi:bacteriocin-like protein